MLQQSHVVAVLLPLMLACAPKVPTYTICSEGAGCGISTADELASGGADYRNEKKVLAHNQYAALEYAGEPIGKLQSQAEKGDATAAYKLGLVHAYRLAGMDDTSPAFAYFDQAASSGLTPAKYELGRLSRDVRQSPAQRQRALKLLTEASDEGSFQAKVLLGEIFFTGGDGLARPNYARAASLFEEAAEAGAVDAQYYLGQMYFRGQGKRQNPFLAIQNTRDAASNGSVIAQRLLGRMYMNGYDTIGQDPAEARKWFTAAAQEGDSESGELLSYLDSGQEISRGPSSVFLPTGDFINASRAFDSALSQARRALTEGRDPAGIVGRSGDSEVRVERSDGNECYELVEVRRVEGEEKREATEFCGGEIET